MCGRYRLSRRKQLIEEYFDIAENEHEWAPRYNIAPTQLVPIIRQNAMEPIRESSLRGGDLSSFLCLDYGCGTVFRLVPGANGSWSEEVLQEFNGLDGSSPYAAVIFDAAGNLYGTTWDGGNVFKLTPGTNGKWTETVLHTFNGPDGLSPQAGLVFDASGNLYGATDYGGKLNACYSQYGDGCGVVFELLP